jgi:hypothetical protein
MKSYRLLQNHWMLGAELTGLAFKETASNGRLLGVRAGVILSSFGEDTNWWTQNGTATGGPPASITGAYLRVVLGGAWNR